MAWPAVKANFDQDGFRRYVATQQWLSWRPSRIVWHNTAAPTLAQWIKTADTDRAAGRIPGITRIQNLERYYRNDNKWSGCPHLFIANDFIWVMNKLTAPGVHSPSFNSTAIGIEMVADFSREDDESGEGLKVKRSTIFATAVLCTALGLDPARAILLHKEDPRTTHDCPGKNIARDKAAMIADVADLMAGGEHDPVAIADDRAPAWVTRQGTVLVDGLNVRGGAGIDNPVIAVRDKGAVLNVLGEARNGSTAWLRVQIAGDVGWVAGRYVQIS